MWRESPLDPLPFDSAPSQRLFCFFLSLSNSLLVPDLLFLVNALYYEETRVTKVDR